MARPEDQQDFEESLTSPSPHELPTELQTKFRIVFGDGLGPEVLGCLIHGMGLFELIPQNDPDAVAQHNVAVNLLRSMGVITDDNIQRIVDALLSVPLENKEK